MILFTENRLIEQPSSKGLLVTVTLDGMENPVWRRLLVPANAHLGWFHAVLQISMGWSNRHLHQFSFKDKRFSDPSFERYDPLAIDEAKGRLDTLLARPESILKYHYDFGNAWNHTIRLNGLGTAANPTPALCLDGYGDCPLEDRLKVPGYKIQLKTRKESNQQGASKFEKPRHPINRSSTFNIISINRSLQELSWPSVSPKMLKRIIINRNKRK